MKTFRHIYAIRGTVQGVGFRPSIYRAAVKAGMTGWISNASDCVLLALEGDERTITGFLRDMSGMIPPNARIESIELVEQSKIDSADLESGFHIKESDSSGETGLVIPADLAMCSECRAEVLAASGRRRAYPFTTCTLCGPRYTVVNAMPYDRERTTMSAFPLCEECASEYTDPVDRRFHAESIACPKCGPRVWVEDRNGIELEVEPMSFVRKRLVHGDVVALRGLGGYLLAVNAFDREALEKLRERKRRPHKPFAVMAANLDVVRDVCVCLPADIDLLCSVQAPVVIMDTLSDARDRVPVDLITPDSATLGVMLPTTPLHQLLFLGGEEGGMDLRLLVMTSGNRRGEPICTGNAEARTRLAEIADCFLMHDREINIRNDDSVCLTRDSSPVVLRRARGFAPLPLRLKRKLDCCAIGFGAEMKNTVALGYDDSVVVSQHIGDLDTPEAVAGLRSVVTYLPGFLGKKPEVVAVDMHPDLNSTRVGREYAAKHDLPLIEVQHHHAHGVACLEENGFSDGLALVLDGTGLGEDGSIWGAELLHVTGEGYSRVATFRPVRLPGGDAAVLYPPRQLVARLLDAGVRLTDDVCSKFGLDSGKISVWQQQCERGVNAPYTHAAGRLFDSFSALLGLAPQAITYDAQAAIRLEAAAARTENANLPSIEYDVLEKDGILYVDWRKAFQPDLHRELQPEERDQFALAFHHAVADAACTMIEYGVGKGVSPRVALSGGVFMNRVFAGILESCLRNKRIECLTHHDFPPNDGCISLGQAVISGRLPAINKGGEERITAKIRERHERGKEREPLTPP